MGAATPAPGNKSFYQHIAKKLQVPHTLEQEHDVPCREQRLSICRDSLQSASAFDLYVLVSFIGTGSSA